MARAATLARASLCCPTGWLPARQKPRAVEPHVQGSSGRSLPFRLLHGRTLPSDGSDTGPCRGCLLVNLVDVVIAVLLFGALVGGAAVAPAIARLFGSPLARVTTGLVAPFVGGGLLGWVGEWAAHRATPW